MKVVVTGASGFLGSAVVAQLSETSAVVCPLTRGDASDAIHVSHYAEAPAGDVLIHLGESAERAVAEGLAGAYERDARATLDALVAKPYRRVIYASSAALYGDLASTPRRPGDPIQTNDVYTRVKALGESAVLKHSGGVVVRLANLYGPKMSPGNVMSTILRQIPGVGPLYVRDGTPVRDFLWVHDAAAAIARMVFADASGIYNVGTGKGVSVSELAALALRLAGEENRAVMETQASGRFSQLVLDISATIATWQWLPATDLGTGLTRLLGTRGHVDA